jgi:hypothetical protein
MLLFHCHSDLLPNIAFLVNPDVINAPGHELVFVIVYKSCEIPANMGQVAGSDIYLASYIQIA